MKRGNEAPAGGLLQKEAVKTPQTASGRYSDPRFQKFLHEDGVSAASPGKDLNILFNYNGHTWDAFEVLGVPAGSGLVEVTKAYQQMLKTSDPDSHQFLETAFKTILAKK